MIWLLGSTGLTGSFVAQYLDQLPELGTNTLALVRNPVGSYQTIQEQVFNFDDEASFLHLAAPQTVICCLGTTIKKAGSKEAFKKIDFDLPLTFAQFAQQKGAQQFILVSSIGADAQSSVFYLRTKGELEERIKSLSFKSTTILRPAGLVGPRKEFRLGEVIGNSIGGLISPLLVGSLKNYRPIQAQTVAKVIIEKAKHPDSGFYILESLEIQNLADSIR